MIAMMTTPLFVTNIGLPVGWLLIAVVVLVLFRPRQDFKLADGARSAKASRAFKKGVNEGKEELEASRGRRGRTRHHA